MAYQIRFRSSVNKDLRKIPQNMIEKIFMEIEELRENPYPVNHKKIKGSINIYRLRVGDYRIVYEVNVEENVIIVIYIRHRKDVYKSF